MGTSTVANSTPNPLEAPVTTDHLPFSSSTFVLQVLIKLVCLSTQSDALLLWASASSAQIAITPELAVRRGGRCVLLLNLQELW
jgi:hypothetical protein